MYIKMDDMSMFVAPRWLVAGWFINHSASVLADGTNSKFMSNHF